MDAPRAGAVTGPSDMALAWLNAARAAERAGRTADAISAYGIAIEAACHKHDAPVLAEALRLLAIQKQHRDESIEARQLCERSFATARDLGDGLLAAEALNTRGGIELSTGAMEAARSYFTRALELGGASGALRARIELNLGILANIRGDLDEALSRYRHALEAWNAARDTQGCAIACHNLGMVSADRGDRDKAIRYFRECRELAARAGDPHLTGLSMVNEAAVEVERQRYEHARELAQDGLAAFDRLEARGAQAEAHRVLGVIERETGQPERAQARLEQAAAIAAAAGDVLGEAGALKELGLVALNAGRNRDALLLLNRAHRGFTRVDARPDVVNVAGNIAALEATYRTVVQAWGESLESADEHTYGHCARVARGAVAVARAMGLDDHAETTVLLAAYLHDVGMVHVPHEILVKPGPLTDEETAIVRLHPVWGTALLAGIEFPWDIPGAIRWHHERVDGTGYPDRLQDDEIPLAAQIIGIMDAYDALTTTRSYRPAMTQEDALTEIARTCHWWREDVYRGFRAAIAVPAAAKTRAT